MKAQMRRRSAQRRRTQRSFPLACDFYESFTEDFTPGVTEASKRPKYPWQGIEKLRDATAGDVLAWRYKKYRTSRTTGHVVIVASEPEHLGGNAYRVVVADSAVSGHSPGDDTRKLGGCDGGSCGVGFGSMFFEVYASGQIKGYRWSSHAGKLNTDADFAIGRFNPEDVFE